MNLRSGKIMNYEISSPYTIFVHKLNKKISPLITKANDIENLFGTKKYLYKLNVTIRIYNYIYDNLEQLEKFAHLFPMLINTVKENSLYNRTASINRINELITNNNHSDTAELELYTKIILITNKIFIYLERV